MTAAPRFHPGPRAMNWLIALTMGATFWAFYMRYLVIEPSVVGLACEAGLGTFTCHMRAITINLFGWSVFGAVALAAALVQLARPSVPVLILALMFSGMGLVLYNNLAAAVASMLIILSLARPGPAIA